MLPVSVRHFGFGNAQLSPASVSSSTRSVNTSPQYQAGIESASYWRELSLFFGSLLPNRLISQSSPSTSDMPPNKGGHHLPVNSMLFDSQFSLRSPRLGRVKNPTLVNVREAADTSVTALPVPSTSTQRMTARKTSVWRRVLGRLKRSLKSSRKKGPVIGGPQDFRHHRTGGPKPLMTVSRKEVGTGQDGESEWEDM